MNLIYTLDCIVDQFRDLCYDFSSNILPVLILIKCLSIVLPLNNCLKFFYEIISGNFLFSFVFCYLFVCSVFARDKYGNDKYL